MEKFTEKRWVEVTANRGVSGSEFTKGVIDYNFSASAPTGIIPAESYLKINCTVTYNSAKPVAEDGVALADSAAAGLFDNAHFLAAGQPISSVVSYAPQSYAVRNRVNASGAWQKQIGRNAMMNEASFAQRVKMLAGEAKSGGSSLYDDRIDLSSGGGAATVAITQASGAVVGTNTDFTKLNVGDFLDVEAADPIRPVRITAIASATGCTVDNTFIVADVGANTPVMGLRNQASDNANKVSLIFQPPLDVFQVRDVLPSGQYRLSLNPNSNYVKAALEHHGTTAGAALINLTVDDMRFYVCTVKMPPSYSIPQELGLKEVHITSKKLDSPSQFQLDFTVPASTYALTVFVQQGAAGTDAAYPPTKFVVSKDLQRRLKTLQLVYANQVKPSTNWGSDYTPASTNQLQQRFIESQMESGLINSAGGSESYEDWLERGQLYHFQFTKPTDDLSTQLQLTGSFDGDWSGVNANVMVCAHYHSRVMIDSQGGRIVNVIRFSS